MQRWLISAGLGALAVLFSIAFVDHPLAELVFNKRLLHLIDYLARLPRLLDIAVTAAVFTGGIFVLVPGNASYRAKATARAAAGVGIAYVLASVILKPVFGRTGPTNWIWGRTDQFQFFGGGDADKFFPSGHAALVMAAAAGLWLLAPSLRRFAAIVGAGMCAAMVLLDIHYLSDVIAGGFIGVAIANLTAKIWRLSP